MTNQDRKMKDFNNRPYTWVPSLYFGEAVPFSAVMLISVIMFKEMGLSDGQITVYTGWLGLPWVVKPLWSPIVDNLRTKRWWILAMQFAMGVMLAMVAFTIQTDFWLQTTLALFMVIAFASATHDISADGFYIIGLPPREQELYVGVRNTFYRIGMVVGQGALVMLAGYWQSRAAREVMEMCAEYRHGVVADSWSIVFAALGVIMCLLCLCHRFSLPRVEDVSHDRQAFVLSQQVREFGKTLQTFIDKPHIVTALCFILLFRLPEGLLTKIVPLFLTRSAAEGGLAMSDVDFGLIYGTLGVIGLLAGGIVGGWAVSRWGLRRCLWPLVMCFTLPDAVYVMLSCMDAASTPLVGACVCFEQFGYGLGFAAYTLYLVTFSRGERSTAVFSICTAFQYLGGVMLPGMVSGLISESMGYQQFFVLIMALCLVTFGVTALVNIPREE